MEKVKAPYICDVCRREVYGTHEEYSSHRRECFNRHYKIPKNKSLITKIPEDRKNLVEKIREK